MKEKITFSDKEKKVYEFLTEEMKTDKSMSETISQYALVKAISKKAYKAMIEVAYKGIETFEKIDEG